MRRHVAAVGVVLAACAVLMCPLLRDRVPTASAPGDTSLKGMTADAAEEPSPTVTDAEREALERLAAIGYVAGSVPAGERSGVTVFDPARAAPGLNFYVSGDAAGATLMDMEGRVRHVWRKTFADVWPGDPALRSDRTTGFWRRAYLTENGDVIAIFEGLGLVKVDRDSEVVWASRCGAHHDLQIRPNGDIWVLTREATTVPGLPGGGPILEDFITVLDSRGREKRRISLIGCFERSKPYRRLWRRRLERRQSGDILHTNSLDVLDRDLDGGPPAFRPGNVLVSFRHLHTIGVVDVGREELTWAQQGPFRGQHDARLLPTGRILLFNNINRREQSSVMEIDPATGQTTWEYEGSTDAPFFSRRQGTAHRLRNGNTLIIESEAGRALEVSPAGEIVWEFRNPGRAGEQSELVATLFDLVRLPPDSPLDWLQPGATCAAPGERCDVASRR